jgi:hypothetical protein
VLPSFGEAKGKGNRNLFAIEDAYLFCYLQALKENELSVKSLERVVSWFNGWSRDEGKPIFRYFRPSVAWLVLNLSSTFFQLDDVDISAETPNPRVLPSQEVNDFHNFASIQVAVNLLKLRHAVNHRAMKILPDAPAVDDSFCECFFHE